jgi:predicted lactoylglutathione lyase
MLLTEPFYKTFTDKEIADASRTQETAARCQPTAGRRSTRCCRRHLPPARELRPAQDMPGFMYSRGFEDPDDHHWDYVWMDPSASQG